MALGVSGSGMGDVAEDQSKDQLMVGLVCQARDRELLRQLERWGRLVQADCIIRSVSSRLTVGSTMQDRIEGVDTEADWDAH